MNPRFVITIEAIPGAVPPIVRLRRALKALQRVFGFSAVRVEEVPAGAHQPPAGASEASGRAVASSGAAEPASGAVAGSGRAMK